LIALRAARAVTICKKVNTLNWVCLIAEVQVLKSTYVQSAVGGCINATAGIEAKRQPLKQTPQVKSERSAGTDTGPRLAGAGKASGRRRT
jgi:hypothetical protein